MTGFNRAGILLAIPLLMIVQGCATMTASDLLGNWRLEYIDGRGVVDNSPAHIEFDQEGRVSGNLSCNTFSGAYSINGRQLDLDRLAVTRRACVSALMDQEARFLAALDRVAGWEVGEPEGWLWLLDGQGERVARASRTTVEE